MLVVIKGAGDLASGVACRLYACGFDIVMTEAAQPTTVRRMVAFSRAVQEETAVVEGIEARLCADDGAIEGALAAGRIAVVADPEGVVITRLHPDAVVDAILAKCNLGTAIDDAPVVAALGPGFTAGVDCHAVVETQRGHNLGRVFYRGSAAENTGIPGSIAGYTSERILRAPCAGVFRPAVQIGDLVAAGQTVATVEDLPVRAKIDGVVRGLLTAGTPVTEGMKSGDVDPRGIRDYCFSVSDKARAIAGGVLEALLHLTDGGKRRG